MKVEFEVGDSKYIYYAIFVVVIVALSAFQYSRNSELKDQLRTNKEEVTQLKSDKTQLLESVQTLELAKLLEAKRADSIELREIYYKNKFWTTNEKLKKTLATYSSATSDERNKLFTGSLSN